MAGFVVGPDGQVVEAGPFSETPVYSVQVFNSDRDVIASYPGVVNFKVNDDNDLQVFFPVGQAFFVGGSWASAEVTAVDNA